MNNAAVPATTNESLTINDFLQAETPSSWVEWALTNQQALLWDHSNCEKKAASNAISLLFKYADHEDVVYRMSRLAREELRHFEQLQTIIQKHNVEYMLVPPTQYAAKLRACIRTTEPNRLIDMLIVGSFIEARSCERFGLLAPRLGDDLGPFYAGLMESESRHFREYLQLARPLCSPGELQQRIDIIGAVEARAALEPATRFAFHSGPPQ